MKYKGLNLKWDTVIERKASGLGRILTGKSPTVDFMEAAPKLERQDTRELRNKILALTASKAKRRGIGKNTLHYLRKKSKEEPLS